MTWTAHLTHPTQRCKFVMGFSVGFELSPWTPFSCACRGLSCMGPLIEDDAKRSHGMRVKMTGQW
jgi:hypothetical protein